MADFDKTFPADTDKTLYLFPEQGYGLDLDDWDTIAVEATEQASPNLGRYDATLDDTYDLWMVFEGATQPTDWNQYVDIISLSVTKDILTTIQSRVAGGLITTVSPVTTTGTIANPLIIGDDYLAADDRAFDWYVDPVGTLADFTCHFGGGYQDTQVWLVEGSISAVTVSGESKWRLRFELTSDVTSLLTNRSYGFSVSLRRTGVEFTRIVGNTRAINRWTDEDA